MSFEDLSPAELSLLTSRSSRKQQCGEEETREVPSPMPAMFLGTCVYINLLSATRMARDTSLSQTKKVSQFRMPRATHPEPYQGPSRESHRVYVTA